MARNRRPQRFGARDRRLGATGTFADADLPEDPTLTFRVRLDEPARSYLNLHSEDFPAAAVRAQLG